MPMEGWVFESTKHLRSFKGKQCCSQMKLKYIHYGKKYLNVCFCLFVSSFMGFRSSWAAWFYRFGDAATWIRHHHTVILECYRSVPGWLCVAGPGKWRVSMAGVRSIISSFCHLFWWLKLWCSEFSPILSSDNSCLCDLLWSFILNKCWKILRLRSDKVQGIENK